MFFPHGSCHISKKVLIFPTVQRCVFKRKKKTCEEDSELILHIYHVLVCMSNIKLVFIYENVSL